VDAATRALVLVRRRIDEERRRRHFDDGPVLETSNLRSSGYKGLAQAAWEATGGDPLLALAYALDVLERRRAA